MSEQRPAVGLTHVRSRLSLAGGGNAFVAGVSVAISLVLAWIVVGVLLRPVQPSALFGRGVALGVALAWVVTLVLVVRTSSRPVAWLEQHVAVRRALSAGLLLASAAVMLRVGMAERFPPGWDAGTAETWAFGLANGTLGPDAYEDVINRYPNNVVLTSALTRWFQVCAALGVDSLGMGVVLLNTVVLSASLVVTWLVARRVGGAAAGYVALALAVPLVVVSPWMGVAYSDTLGMLFPITVVLLFLMAREARPRWVSGLCFAGIGAVGLLGYHLKPTVVFVIVAVVAAGCVEWWGRGRTRAGLARVGAVAGGAVAGLLVTTVALGLVVDPLGIEPEGDEKIHAMPLTHFLMMGAGVQEPFSWGGWSGADVQRSLAVPPEDRFANGLRVYRDRVVERGPIGYADFLDEKANWVFGDGNFYAFGEGKMSSPGRGWEFHDETSRSLRPWLTPHHEEYRWVALVRHATWLAVLLLLVAPAFWWRRGLHGLESTVMRVALAGLVVFLLFFEARSRYLYLYLPLLLVLASLTAVRLAEVFRAAPSRDVITVGRSGDRE